MKKSILILSGCVGLLCLSLLSACSKDEEGTNPPDDGGGDNEEEVVDGDDEEDAVLTLSLDSITVDSGAGRQTVELTSNTEWEIDNPNSLLSWCVVSPVRGQAGTVTLTVEVSANESYDMREHTFNIVAGTETVLLTVSQRQLGYLDFRLASAGGNIFLDEGGICEVLATTSVEYEIEYTDNGGEWVSLLQTKTLEDETLLFRIAEYTGDSQRECDIVFKEVGGEKDTIHIVQYHDTEVEFEDAEFGRYCLEHFDDDGDGRFIGREAQKVHEMDISSLGITSLSGIEAFENLEVLDCSDNELSSLDLRQNKKLKILDCNDNPLISLDVSGFTSLQSLYCASTNLMTSLNASGCTSLQDLSFNRWSVVNINLSGCTNLKIDFWQVGNPYKSETQTLDISDCPGVQRMMLSVMPQLTSVDVSGCTNLQFLSTHQCNLTTLDVSGCTSLQTLQCLDNPLTNLDVSGCINLQDLKITEGWDGICSNLTSLDLSDCSALQTLNCRNNQLTSLDLSDCSALQTLDCVNNQLTSLDLSNCPALYELNCDVNRLTSLDLSSCPDLYYLGCSSNQLTTLDVSFCPDLYKLYCYENRLTSLDLSNCPALYELYCYGNRLTSLDLSSCPDLDYFSCGDNPLQSMTILQEQKRKSWMSDIKMEYPDIEIILK